jgi:hypothetical protein
MLLSIAPLERTSNHASRVGFRVIKLPQSFHIHGLNATTGHDMVLLALTLNTLMTSRTTTGPMRDVVGYDAGAF